VGRRHRRAGRHVRADGGVHRRAVRHQAQVVRRLVRLPGGGHRRRRAGAADRAAAHRRVPHHVRGDRLRRAHRGARLRQRAACQGDQAPAARRRRHPAVRVPGRGEMNSVAVQKIRQHLKSAGLAGYVAATPSNVFYVTGFRSYFLSEWWRMHGTVFALVPADDAAPVTLVLSDFERGAAASAAPDVEVVPYRLWVDLHTAEELADPAATGDVPRPAQYDPAELDRALATALHDLGMATGAVGTDLPFLTVATHDRFRRVAPGADWVDCSGAVYDVRLVKEPWEVDRLALGVELS